MFSFRGYKDSSLHAHRIDLLKYAILAAITCLAFLIRLFPVLRFENAVHEYIPHFNLRAAKVLASEGFFHFRNWFDDRSWYPLGRVVGESIHSGLVAIAANIYWILNCFNTTVNIRVICVYLPPCIASVATIFAYGVAKEAMLGSSSADKATRHGTPAQMQAAKLLPGKATAAGILAAALLAVCPGFASRSMAGAFVNAGAAMCALLLTCYAWIMSVKQGSLCWGLACACSYCVLAATWGGYIFVTNLMPLYVMVMLAAGRYSTRLYTAYCTWFVLGTLLCMQLPTVGTGSAHSMQHMPSLAVFGVVQAREAARVCGQHVSAEQWHSVRWVWRSLLLLAATAALCVMARSTDPLPGRLYGLMDPAYGNTDHPLVASMSENSPTTWASYFIDLHLLAIMTPLGVYVCFQHPTDGKVFLLCYATTAIYFSSVMVRLVLVAAPAACLVSAIGITEFLFAYLVPFRAPTRAESKKKKVTRESEITKQQDREAGAIMLLCITLCLCFYCYHCVWVVASMYSAPSIIMEGKAQDGSRLIFDDYREAYSWLRMNTAPDAKILSWLDYGYQVSALSNRSVIVDNNGWNTTHVATVGRALASSERDAYPILRSLDVDYVLVVFGGLTGYASDDLNKFVWMLRVGQSVFPEHIREKDYFTPLGRFRVDSKAPDAMTQSLLYKLSYYRFGLVPTQAGRGSGYDRVREAEIGVKDFELEYLEEAMTTRHWIVRIYKVKNRHNRIAFAAQ